MEYYDSGLRPSDRFNGHGEVVFGGVSVCGTEEESGAGESAALHVSEEMVSWRLNWRLTTNLVTVNSEAEWLG